MWWSSKSPAVCLLPKDLSLVNRLSMTSPCIVRPGPNCFQRKLPTIMRAPLGFSIEQTPNIKILHLWASARPITGSQITINIDHILVRDPVVIIEKFCEINSGSIDTNA